MRADEGGSPKDDLAENILISPVTKRYLYYGETRWVPTFRLGLAMGAKYGRILLRRLLELCLNNNDGCVLIRCRWLVSNIPGGIFYAFFMQFTTGL
jgi:hypothetical protein